MPHIDQKTPWTYDYNPYRTNDGREIPCFEIVDSDGRRLAQTDEDTPETLQRADAQLMAAAPELLAALEAYVIYDGPDRGEDYEAIRLAARDAIRSAIGDA
jgi:hypothetical protein